MRPAIQAICEEVAAHFGYVTAEEIAGRGRSKSEADARAVAMWLARQRFKLSYPEVGREFSRDHTTVMSAVAKAESATGMLRWSADELLGATGDRARQTPREKVCQEQMCGFGGGMQMCQVLGGAA